MEKFLSKCLLRRDECFNMIEYPQWIDRLYPEIKELNSMFEENVDENRSKSINLIEDERKEMIDEFDENLIDRIQQIDQRKYLNEFEENQVEYPHFQSYFSLIFDHFHQCSIDSSNKQLIDLFENIQMKFKRKSFLFNEDKFILQLENEENRCHEINCDEHRIPLSQYCQKHFFQNDEKQILFDRCSSCQQIFIRHDQKNIFHLSSFCPHLHLK